jgi:hypothetical protein
MNQCIETKDEYYLYNQTAFKLAKKTNYSTNKAEILEQYSLIDF